MRLRTLPVLLACLAVVAFAAGIAYADVAYAGDGPGRKPPSDESAKSGKTKDYVAKLSKEELAFLKARIKDWGGLPPQKKQMIARNVVRLRNMSPEQRKHFERRLKHMRESKRWGHMRDHAGRMLVDRGLAHAARKHLGREFEARLRRSDISDHIFERSFGRIFWDKVRQAAFEDGKPVAPDALPKGLPRPLVERYAQEFARFEATEDAEQRKRMLRGLGHRYSNILAGKLRHDLTRSDVKSTDAYIALVGRTVQRTWPKEFRESLQDPEALLRSLESQELKRSLVRLWRRDGKLRGEEAGLLVKLVERWTTHNRKNEAEAGADADALIRRVLRDELHVKPELLDSMPSRADLEKRAAWYLRVLGHIFGRHLRKDGRPGRGMRVKLPKPDGISDGLWGQVQKAWREAMQERRPPRKPEGVEQGVWDGAVAAWKKQLEAFKQRRRGK